MGESPFLLKKLDDLDSSPDVQYVSKGVGVEVENTSSSRPRWQVSSLVSAYIKQQLVHSIPLTETSIGI